MLQTPEFPLAPSTTLDVQEQIIAPDRYVELAATLAAQTAAGKALGLTELHIAGPGASYEIRDVPSALLPETIAGLKAAGGKITVGATVEASF